MKDQTTIARVPGTDKWRVTIDHIEHTLSEPAFLRFAQQVLDKLQTLTAARESPARPK